MIKLSVSKKKLGIFLIVNTRIILIKLMSLLTFLSKVNNKHELEKEGEITIIYSYYYIVEYLWRVNEKIIRKHGIK